MDNHSTKETALVAGLQARCAFVPVAFAANAADEALVQDEFNGGRDGGIVGTHRKQSFNTPRHEPACSVNDERCSGEPGAGQRGWRWLHRESRRG